MVARCAQEGLDVCRSALGVSRLPRAAYECAPAASDRSPGSGACRHHQACRRSYAAALPRHASPGAEDRHSRDPGSRCCSKQRHTARQHPVEGRIYYPFHPRCGESVLILRQYAYRDAELVVIPQPDGSVAGIPAWMTHESAARHQLAEPRLSLDNLRSLRAEIDALLSFLQSDAGMEHANNEAQERKRSAGPVRTGL